MLDFQVTNPVSGRKRYLVLKNTVASALKLRDIDGVPFFNTYSRMNPNQVTMANHLGLDYAKMEALRRSPEFAEEVDTYIANSETAVATESTRVRLGVMPPERQARQSDGHLGFNRSVYQEIGIALTERIQSAVFFRTYNTDKYVSPEFVKSIISDYLKIDDTDLDFPELPTRPVKTPRSVETKQDLRKRAADAEKRAAEAERKLAEADLL